MKDLETYKDANLSHWDSVLEGHYHSEILGLAASDTVLKNSRGSTSQ